MRAFILVFTTPIILLKIINQGNTFVPNNCRYGDLLALVEDIEDSKSTRVLRQVPSRRASQAATKLAGGIVKPSKKGHADDSDSSSESTDVSFQMVSCQNRQKYRNIVISFICCQKTSRPNLGRFF